MPRVIQFPDSPARFFAVDVVRRLRDVGFESVWAGGCVRDVLLGRPPVDFDIATSARPDDIIRLFGKKRSISVGAAFGVIIVLGRHRDQGQVEVATFRCDGNYSDGRRPDHVTYCSAKEDACRRDFTINGMFYDRLEAPNTDAPSLRAAVQASLLEAGRIRRFSASRAWDIRSRPGDWNTEHQYRE